MIPPSHIFEGMRTVILEGTPPIGNLLWATILNFGYLAVSVKWFYHTFEVCKDQGMLVRVGE
jgi:ABC-2 type transport system permease protein